MNRGGWVVVLIFYYATRYTDSVLLFLTCVRVGMTSLHNPLFALRIVI